MEDFLLVTINNVDSDVALELTEKGFEFNARNFHKPEGCITQFDVDIYNAIKVQFSLYNALGLQADKSKELSVIHLPSYSVVEIDS